MDDEFGGELDIAVYATTPSEMPVLYIVEAKKYDFDQGRAQLYPQLKICFESGVKDESWTNAIYGVITTAHQGSYMNCLNSGILGIFFSLQ